MKIKSNHSVEHYLQLGHLLHKENRLSEAIICYRQALGVNPNNHIAWNNLGAALYMLGRQAEAQTAYEEAIKIKKNYSEALYNLGVLFKVQGRYGEAIGLLRKSIRIKPNHIESHLALAQMYAEIKQFASAIREYQKTIRLSPNNPKAYKELGSIYLKTGNLPEAIKHYKTAIKLKPSFVEAWSGLASSYYTANKEKEAEKTFKKAIEENPNNASLYYSLADLLENQGRLNETAEVIKRGIKVDTNKIKPYDMLFETFRKLCNWKEAAKAEKNLIKKGSENPFTSILRHENYRKNFDDARFWCNLIKKRLRPAHFYYHSSQKKRRIRLGYLSRDFHGHPVGQLTAAMFAYHNRAVFDVWALSYSQNYPRDNFQHMIKKGVDKFINIYNLQTLNAAHLINENKIDILIDLAGHTTDNRIEIMAFRPAPIQVTWLGFPGTTGADFIDYVIVDKVIAPKKYWRYFSENIVCLPRCYQINNNKIIIPQKEFTRKDFNLPGKGVIFVSFVQALKIDLTIWKVWMNILRQVPESILWLWEQNKDVTKNLRKEAEKENINPKRLFFSPRLPKPDHLNRLKLADIALDTRIYGGHTTTSDMLWAGVPVITKIGNHFASRVCASILTEAGIPELITRSLKEYEDKAVYLANHPEELAKIRKKITQENLEKNLYDTEGFVRDLERAYLAMWKRYKNGQIPTTINLK